MNRSVDEANHSSQFIIKYEEKELQRYHKPDRISKPEIKRYSSRQECEKIKHNQFLNRVSHPDIANIKVVQKTSKVPSYLKPTEAAISAQLAKNRAISNTQLLQQKKKQQLQKLMKKSLEKEVFEIQEEYNRVPIQYFDERDYGCGVDAFRTRVTFRGYAPKNSYYYMKTLKPINFQTLPTQLNSMPLRNQFELKFQSKFESGNLSAAAKISQTLYYLYMREDTNTHGLRQWFYFQVRNFKAVKVKFRLYKFSKSHSLYRYGMKPFVRIRSPSTRFILSEWTQKGQKVKYQFDKLQHCFYLEFEFNFEEDNEEVQFAMLPPYTYSMLKDYLKNLEDESYLNLERLQGQEDEGKEKEWKTHVGVQSAGNSLVGLNIPFIKIKTNRGEKYSTKQAIFVMARTHPGETVSSWSVQTFISKVLKLPQLCKFFDFFIIPMVNPDGVFFGNHRTSVIGQDLNRNFHASDLETFPEIEAVQWAIREVKKSHKIRFVIDLHGHSSRKNIFAYGQEHEINSRQYLHSRILPKLLNDSISSFKYQYCIFRESTQKKNTARVFFGSKFGLNCLTFEQSYGLLDEGPIGISVWRNFGEALAQSLLKFAQIYEKGRELSLSNYLQEEIGLQRKQLEKRIIKHKILLGLQQKTPAQENQDNSKQSETFEAKQNTQLSKLMSEQKQEERQIFEEHIQDDGSIDENQCYQEYNEGKQYSLKSSELQSGDDSLELLNEELESIKKQIVKFGCLKDGLKRQKYQIAENKLQLFERNEKKKGERSISSRLHDHKSTMIPRIVKFQMKKKEQYVTNIKVKSNRSSDIIEKEREERRIEIQNKFKRMELPSIKR